MKLFYYIHVSIVNGNWGAWVPLEECPVTCGGGLWRRKRSCDNPRSSFGGLDCLLTGGEGKRGKQEEGVHQCNTHTCLGKDGTLPIISIVTIWHHYDNEL